MGSDQTVVPSGRTRRVSVRPPLLPTRDDPTPGRLRAYLQLIRPRQWTKNLFVLGPLLFGHRWWDPAAVAMTFQALVAFTFGAAAVYCFNDSLDVEADRRHPLKRFRPIASGAVGVTEARVFAGSLAVLGLAAGWLVNPAAAGIVLLYLGLNTGYCLGWKHLPVLDVMLIAAGFLLRALMGCASAGVLPSSWLLSCTTFLAMFLGLLKRRSELVAAGDDPGGQRAVLLRYTVPMLDQMITSILSITLLSYMLYSSTVHGPVFLITSVFVIHGVFRYLYLAHGASQAERPEEMLLTDLPLALTVGLWAVSCLVLLALER